MYIYNVYMYAFIHPLWPNSSRWTVEFEFDDLGLLLMRIMDN